MIKRFNIIIKDTCSLGNNDPHLILVFIEIMTCNYDPEVQHDKQKRLILDIFISSQYFCQHPIKVFFEILTSKYPKEPQYWTLKRSWKDLTGFPIFSSTHLQKATITPLRLWQVITQKRFNMMNYSNISNFYSFPIFSSTGTHLQKTIITHIDPIENMTSDYPKEVQYDELFKSFKLLQVFNISVDRTHVHEAIMTPV